MVPWSARGGTGDAASASWSVAMTADGLVCGAGSVLARMGGPVGQPRRLALDRDGDRLLAMLSVVVGRPIPAGDVLPHVSAASAHWQRGDKALANLRLVFARLPKPGDPAAVERLAKAGRLLDGGMAPQALIRALSPLADLARAYDPNQPRIPANHAHGGEWTFAEQKADDGQARSSRRLRVAQTDLPHPPANPLIEDVEDFKHNAAAPFHTPEKFHFRIFDPLMGGGGGFTPAAIKPVAQAFGKALATVGPGKGPVYGTAVHTQLKENVRALGNEEIFAEQSYKNGERANYGTPGSIRVDAGLGSPNKPTAIIDAKTGGASLDPARVRQMMKHLPGGGNIPIIEMKP